MSYTCGITLDPVHGAKQIEYLEEIDKIVDAKDIVSIGKNTDGRTSFSSHQKNTLKQSSKMDFLLQVQISQLFQPQSDQQEY